MAQQIKTRFMKVTHLKKRADSFVEQAAYGRAIDGYSQALQVLSDLPSSNTAKALLQRTCLLARSTALEQVGRHQEALQDADSAIIMQPSWLQAHFRRGRALEGLNRLPEALESYLAAWKSVSIEIQEPTGPTCHQAMVRCLDKFTLQQVADGMLQLLQDLAARGGLTAMDGSMGATTSAELREAAFVVVKGSRSLSAQQYLHWLKQGVPAWEAYLLRSKLYRIATRFDHAQLDAFKAVELLCHTLPAPESVQDAVKETSTHSSSATTQLAHAYMALAEAYMAKPGHPQQQLQKAVVCLSQAAMLEPDEAHYSQALAQVLSQLSDADMALAVAESEGWAGMLGLLNEGINVPDMDTPQEVYRVDMCIRLASLPLPKLWNYSRKELVEAIAAAAATAAATVAAGAAAQVGAASAADAQAQHGAQGVVLEQVLHPTGTDPWAYFKLKVPLVGSYQHARDICHKLQDQQTVDAIKAIFHHPDGAGTGDRIDGDGPDLAVRTHLVDVSVTCQKYWEQKHQRADELALIRPAVKDIQVFEEETSLAIPYKDYHLSDADGAPVERPYKHPFCMSRVHYSSSDHGRYVWVETSDGACRWRQSASEVCIIATKVPCGMTAKALEVRIEPFHLRVSNSSSGEVYLEGDLERGIIPEDSVWTYGGGQGEDGCILYLEKMNLELYQQYWQHSRSWWPRLMTHHALIAWDDYDKDYSDLPSEILAAHEHQERQEKATRHQEALEGHQRKQAQGQMDERRRKRQDQLLRALRRDPQ